MQPARYLLLGLVFLMLVSAANCLGEKQLPHGKIKGQIVDADTKLPLIGANIQQVLISSNGVLFRSPSSVETRNR